MILPDVNVLVEAHRSDAVHHEESLLDANAPGTLVPDASLAALAIEYGATSVDPGDAP